jgi:hypothetical protein
MSDFRFEKAKEDEARHFLEYILNAYKDNFNPKTHAIRQGLVRCCMKAAKENRLNTILNNNGYLGIYVKSKNNKLPEYIFLDDQYLGKGYEAAILQQIIGTLKPGVHHIDLELNHPLLNTSYLAKIYKSVGFVPIVSPDEHTVSLAVITY